MDIEAVAKIIVDTAIHVHRALGPGLLESAYQHCPAHELRKRGLKVETELLLPLLYDGHRIDAGYRMCARKTCQPHPERTLSEAKRQSKGRPVP
ncbi:MAG: GxxExxY protein [Anaerolineales bacterium]|nr:GxxExxY protein [Anaerolineales bacterium]